MRIFACVSVIAALSASHTVRAQPAAAPAAATVTVVLSNFDFSPDHLRLSAGVPVRLRLVNESGGGHDFSAPGFFAASNVLPGGAAPSGGAVAVGSHRTEEVLLVPRTPGTYRLECTHFLHSVFGMHGTIDIVP